MTVETYMKRFHDPDSADGDSLVTAEELFPCREETAEEDCRCPSEPDEDDDCCCKRSMIDALRLLCSTELSDLVDFDAFFFLTDTLAIGSTLFTPRQAEGPSDNITDPDATFRRFSPCNCDLLEVEAAAYYNSTTSPATALDDADQVSTCAVKAVAFDLADRGSEAENFAAFRRAVRILRRELGSGASGCGTCGAHCDCDTCCCAEGIVRELSGRNLSRTATLTVGPLVLRDVTVLGSKDKVLVLANEDLRRFYLVCANSVEALG